MSAAKPQRERGLMALFTATPQLKPWEKNLAERAEKADARTIGHVLRMSIQSKVYEAKSHHYAGIAAMHRDDKVGREVADKAHNSAVLDIIELISAYLSCPSGRKATAADQRKMIRSGATAAAGSGVMGFWRDAEARWLKTLDGGAA